MSDETRKPLDIDKAAIFLIKKHGEDCACVAYSRANCCRCRGDALSEREWLAVLERVVDLYFAPRQTPLQ